MSSGNIIAEETKPEDWRCTTHKWDKGREVGRTGDWFHPLIVEYRCTKCGTTKTEDV